MFSKPKVIVLIVFAAFFALLASNLPAQSVSASLTPTLDVNPQIVIPNQKVTLFGRGFTPAEEENGVVTSVHQITGEGASVISVNGTPLQSPDVTYPINFDSSGSWAASITVPQTLESLSGVRHEITAVDDQGVSQSTTMEFVVPVIRVDMETSSRGADLILSGLGFPSTNTATAPKVDVSVTYAGVELGVISPNYFGEISAIYLVPETAETPSTNVVQATMVGYNRAASTFHYVPSASITPSPTSGKSGSIVTVTASDFPALSSVSSIRVGNIVVTETPAPSTDRNGDFESSFIMPLLDAGDHTITARAGGVSAVVSFTVTEGTELGQTLPASESQSGPVKALETLTLGENLVRVWTFDNASKAWTFFDPRPAFAKVNSITEMVAGRVYWIELNRDQTTPLNGSSRVLFNGWNLVPWSPLGHTSA